MNKKFNFDFTLVEITVSDNPEMKNAFRLKWVCPRYEIAVPVGPLMTKKSGQITYYMYRESVTLADGSELKAGKEPKDADGNPIVMPIEHFFGNGMLIPTQFKVIEKAGKIGTEFEGMYFKQIVEMSI